MTSYCQAISLLELLMIKRGILLVPVIVFSARDIDNVMRDMSNAAFFEFFSFTFFTIIIIIYV